MLTYYSVNSLGGAASAEYTSLIRQLITSGKMQNWQDRLSRYLNLLYGKTSFASREVFEVINQDISTINQLVHHINYA